MLTRPTLMCPRLHPSEPASVPEVTRVTHEHGDTCESFKREATNGRSVLDLLSGVFCRKPPIWLWEGLVIRQYMLDAIAAMYEKFICCIQMG